MPKALHSLLLALLTLTLGLTVCHDTPEEFTVQVGRSRLSFRRGHTPAAHFAVDIPRTLVAQAQAWLEARVPLLADSARPVPFTARTCTSATRRATSPNSSRGTTCPSITRGRSGRSTRCTSVSSGWSCRT